MESSLATLRLRALRRVIVWLMKPPNRPPPYRFLKRLTPHGARDNQLRNTVIAVLLTFLFSTVCGALLNLVVLQNQSESKSAEDDTQGTLKTYDQFITGVEPKFQKSESAGYDMMHYAESHTAAQAKQYVAAHLDALPDTGSLPDEGDVTLYFGKDAGLYLHYLSQEHLALRVMLDRRGRLGTLKVDSDLIQSHLIEVLISYKFALLQVLQCKRNASEKFDFWGKLEHVRDCEKKFSYHADASREIWGPGVFDNPENAKLPYPHNPPRPPFQS